MTEHFFDHDRLDVYRLSIEYVAKAFDFSRSLEGFHRHACDQWLRSAQSITKTSTAMLSTSTTQPASHG
ncbi:hypothetical protein SH467x_002970 [Pirellulaceae bacterium SH467]